MAAAAAEALNFWCMSKAQLWQWVEANPGRVNDRDMDGYTPLTAAVAYKKGMSLIMWLLDEKGVDVNATTLYGSSALHYANSLDILTALLDPAPPLPPPSILQHALHLIDTHHLPPPSLSPSLSPSLLPSLSHNKASPPISFLLLPAPPVLHPPLLDPTARKHPSLCLCHVGGDRRWTQWTEGGCRAP